MLKPFFPDDCLTEIEMRQKCMINNGGFFTILRISFSTSFPLQLEDTFNLKFNLELNAFDQINFCRHFHLSPIFKLKMHFKLKISTFHQFSRKSQVGIKQRSSCDFVKFEILCLQYGNANLVSSG